MVGALTFAEEAALAALKNQSPSPEEVANKVVWECRGSVENPPPNNDVTDDGNTPGLESFLWTLWTDILDTATKDPGSHERLAQVLAALKAQGEEGCAGWRVYGDSFVWARLPGFGLASRECMNGPIEFSNPHTPEEHTILAGDAPSADPAAQTYARIRNEWLNINAFFARLWNLDVQDQAFFAIATMRMRLEPLSITSTTDPTPTPGLPMYDPPQELDIEVAATWIRLAGARMLACREIFGPNGNPGWQENQGRAGASGGTWAGVDGFHPDRWAHWKSIFVDVANGTWRESVRQAAQAAVEAMERAEREVNSAY